MTVVDDTDSLAYFSGAAAAGAAGAGAAGASLALEADFVASVGRSLITSPEDTGSAPLVVLGDASEPMAPSSTVPVEQHSTTVGSHAAGRQQRCRRCRKPASALEDPARMAKPAKTEIPVRKANRFI
ncbi:MAG: hypothetical protein ACKOCN_02845 [Planctomycetaceae bacterium]